MENHPIPQDVTGFKFKLIGSVTVKQFLYLLGGGVLAVVTFWLPFPGLLKFPFILLFGGTGTALAFIPIEGRPMDVMIKNFLKALPTENQYIYHKKGADVLIGQYFSPPVVVAVQKKEEKKEGSELDSKRAMLFKTLRKNGAQDSAEQSALKSINSYFNDSSAHPVTMQQQRVDDIPKPLQIAQPLEEDAKKEEEKAKKEIKPEQGHMPESQKQAEPQKHFEAKAVPLPKAPEVPQQIDVSPKKTTPPPPGTKAEEIAPEAQLKGGFPQLPDTPNIVLGIVRDPRQKVLPNMLVEIMDPNGIPVRAFKTNQLGQFAAATPLPDGNYTVIIEDTKKLNEFEPINIMLDGKIFEPIEITSLDQREKLRRELFGAQQSAAA